jgi:MoaA/NifB/PqqE/SkfB family radical SAM enzyme
MRSDQSHVATINRKPPHDHSSQLLRLARRTQQVIRQREWVELHRGFRRVVGRGRRRLRLEWTRLRGWRRFERRPPATLKVEITNICNANCIFCAYQYEERPKTFMADDLYQKSVMDFAALGGNSLSYVPIVGEPLVDRRFVEKVKLAKQHGMRDVYTYTNALLLHRINLDALLTSGIDRLIVSTAPFDEEMYERMYRNKGYRQLLRNLRQLLVRNIELGRLVRITFCVRSYVDERTALSLPDYIQWIRPYINEATDIGVMTYYDNWGGLITEDDLIGEMKLIDSPEDKSVPCLQTFTLTVLTNGQVRACGCRFNKDDPDDPLIVGDVRTQSLSEIWHGEALKSLRRRFETNQLPSLCQKCSAYQPKIHA